MTEIIKQRIEQIKQGKVPQGYKKTEVGIVPQEWEYKKLETIAKLCGGGTPSTKNKSYWNGDIPWISSSDVYQNYINSVNINRYITKEAIDNSATKLCPKGSILIVSRVGVGKVAIAPVDLCTSQDFTNIVETKINNEYLTYYLIKKINNDIKFLQGTSIKGITVNEIRNYEILCPKTKEQERIADILSKWDEAVTLQTKLIEKLELQKKALMQKLLTPKEGWKPVPLKKILKERKTYSIKGQEYTHVTLSKQGVCDKTEQYERDFLVASEDKRYKITHCNDLCYNPANLKFGVICLNKYGDAIFSPIYVTFEIFNKYNSDFIGAVLTSVNFVNKIRRFEEGSLYERQAVKPNDFIKDKVLIPDKETQDKIANIVITLDRKITLQAQKLEKLKQQQKSLMQLLLTGIVRV